jgi:tRNA pseudouridine38-40 synthase
MDDHGPPPEGGPVASGRWRIDVAYDGSGFHGFAENRGVPTVAGTLRGALERVLGVPVELTCAGRTDRGVHAVGQVVTVVPGSGARPMDPDRLRDGLNGLVGPAVVVRAVAPADPGFDARHSATSRTYRYRVLSSAVPDPFLATTAWWVDRPLDRAALAAACPPLLGEHDFSSFCRRPRGVEVSLVRRVTAAEWRSAPPGAAPHLESAGAELVEFWITATAFCHQMVRSIVGLLVDVGVGRRTPADVTAAIRARDRARVPSLAPPHGLTLWHVDYDDTPPSRPPPAAGEVPA